MEASLSTLFFFISFDGDPSSTWDATEFLETNYISRYDSRKQSLKKTKKNCASRLPPMGKIPTSIKRQHH